MYIKSILDLSDAEAPTSVSLAQKMQIHCLPREQPIYKLRAEDDISDL